MLCFFRAKYIIIYYRFLERLLCTNAFSKTERKEKLGKTLDSNDHNPLVYRWHKVGEKIFENSQGGLKKLNQILREKGMIETFRFFENFGSRFPDLRWSEFKHAGIEKGISDLNKLKFDNGKRIASMDTTQKEQIAETMIPMRGWERFIDHYIKDVNDRELLKNSIQNSSHQATSYHSSTEKILNLVKQIHPEFTMKEFFAACKKLTYNDTLKDIKEICDIVEQEQVSKNKNK